MKFIVLFALLLSEVCIAQETATFQNDTIYRLNRVKSRKWFSGNPKTLFVTTFYNRDGRLVKYQVEPLDGAQLSTYYHYNEKGQLVGIVDTIHHMLPQSEPLTSLGKRGVNAHLIANHKNVPKAAVEVANYTLQFKDNQLTMMTRMFPDRSINFIDALDSNGRRHIRSWYLRNNVFRRDTSVFWDDLHKTSYSGCESISGEEQNQCWRYSYLYTLKNKRIAKVNTIEKGKIVDVARFYYNEKGLLIGIDSQVAPEYFEYEYY